MRIIELFAGIGACSTALKRIGQDIEIVDAVEIDKYAIASFNAIHGTNFETQDITLWDKDFRDIDLIAHGSPCQDFSVAGKQAGGDIGSGTRSSLMYETIRIVGKISPKYVLWENVKNILSKKHKHNFDAYIETMKNLGYTSYYQVLNAKDYGIPQNRERVYTISIRNDINKTFNFPDREILNLRLKDMLEENVEEKYFLKDKPVNKMSDIEGQSGLIQPVDRKYKEHGIKREEHIEFKNDNCSHALRTNVLPVVCNKMKIRKLTPKECWRLMGFSDEDLEKAKKINSDTQLYKQAGNSIVVNVLEKIFKSLF